uniref:B box-type domain-containing protein n=1 Tax=Electrophorus electricus TaxID=8005 RepID=A0A4W4FQF3_ELEEL
MITSNRTNKTCYQETERICPEHDKPLQVFCRTDQLCVCYLCLADKHKGHEVVTIEEEVAETQVSPSDNEQDGAELRLACESMLSLIICLPACSDP